MRFYSVVREPAFWVAIAICCAARLAGQLQGNASFDVTTPFWQILDDEWLRQSPVWSLYLMHMQPPLLNALRALALAMPAGIGTVSLQMLFMLCSMIMVAIIYFFGRRFGLRPVTAAATSCLFGLMPQTLIYENIFFYPHLEATLLAAATLFSARYLEERRLSSFIGLAACLAALGLLRSLFHVAWIAVAMLTIWGIAGRRHGRDLRSLAVAVAALAVVSAVYAKNLSEFGVFAASSWLGPSMAGMLLVAPNERQKFPEIDQDIRARADRGEFSRSLSAALASGDVWTGWTELAKGCTQGQEDVAVLCAIKGPAGELNYNNVAMVDYARELKRDAIRLVRLYPGLYLRHVGSALKGFLAQPSWSGTTFDIAFKRYAEAWDKLLLFRPGSSGASGWRRYLGGTSLPYAALVLAGLAITVSRGAREMIAYSAGRKSHADWVFPALAVALFLVVPNLLNGRETQRVRYSIEPILFLALVDGAARVGRRQTS